MSDYRTLNRLILAKVEATPGIDAAPAVGTDAILVEDPQTTPGIQALETNEVTGALDPRAPVPGGGGSAISFAVNVKGSGAGGTAPEWGTLLKGCGFAEDIQATDITGTATAGAASTITLADAANVEIGHVIETTGGTGSGQTRVCTAKAGNVVTVYPAWTTPPDATTTYSVHAAANYAPASSGISHLTLYDYQHSSSSGVNSRLRKVLGAQGTVDFNFPSGQVGRANFNFQGKFVQPSDVAHPGAGTFDAQRPVAFLNATISHNSVAEKINALSFSCGNEIVAAPDPQDQFGVDVGQITRRRITGRIVPPLDLLSVRNVWTDFLAGTTRQLWIKYGTANGNEVSIYFPQILYTGQETEDVSGLAYEGIPFAAQGEDTGVYINIS